MNCKKMPVEKATQTSDPKASEKTEFTPGPLHVSNKHKQETDEVSCRQRPGVKVLAPESSRKVTAVTAQSATLREL